MNYKGSLYHKTIVKMIRGFGSTSECDRQLARVRGKEQATAMSSSWLRGTNAPGSEGAVALWEAHDQLKRAGGLKKAADFVTRRPQQIEALGRRAPAIIKALGELTNRHSLSYVEIAEYLGVSEEVVSMWSSSGLVPNFKIGKLKELCSTAGVEFNPSAGLLKKRKGTKKKGKKRKKKDAGTNGVGNRLDRLEALLTRVAEKVLVDEESEGGATP